MSSKYVISLSATNNDDAKRQKTNHHLNSPKFVNLKFVNQDNEETFLKVSRDAKLGRAFAKYYEHHNLDYHVDFTYDGDRVNRHLTPFELDLKDGDIIDVFKHVYGGGSELLL